MQNKSRESSDILEEIRLIYKRMGEEYKMEGMQKSFEKRCDLARTHEKSFHSFLETELLFVNNFFAELKQKSDTRQRVIQRYKDTAADKHSHKHYEICEHYSDLDHDVAALYSAIEIFLNTYWTTLKFFIDSLTQTNSISNLKRNIENFYSEDKVTVPYYIRNVRTFNEGKHSAIQRLRKAQQTLQAAGIWLNNLREILASAKLEGELPFLVEEADKHLTDIIQDFRLKIFLKKM